MEIKKISEEQARKMYDLVFNGINISTYVEIEGAIDLWKESGFIVKTKLEDCIDRLNNIKSYLCFIPQVRKDWDNIIKDLESIADDMK